MKKRGNVFGDRIGSHVGMILSFVIFVTFIVFLYAVMKPVLNTGEDKKSLIGYIETQMIQNVTSNLTIASVTLNTAQSGDKNCIKLNEFFTVLLETMPIGATSARVIVKNGFEEVQPVYNNNNKANNIIDPNLRINRDARSGIVSSITVTNQGRGYDSRRPPTVTFSGSGGAKATAIVSKDGKVTSVVINNVGGGYTVAPIISFTNTHGGRDAAATATIRDNTFFKVYYSQTLDATIDGTTDCTSLNIEGANAGYTIGSVTIDKYIFEENVLNFKTEYDTNYEQLKTNLNIPPGSEFEFKFTKSNGEFIIPAPTERLKPSQLYVEEIPVQYIDNNANIQSGFISITVW